VQVWTLSAALVRTVLLVEPEASRLLTVAASAPGDSDGDSVADGDGDGDTGDADDAGVAAGVPADGDAR
jgi:hypothetical protein